MPVININGPYPTYEQVMNLARAYVNDTMAGSTGATGEGQIFTDSAPMTLPFLRAVTAELYQELGNTGGGVVIRDNYVLTGLPAMMTTGGQAGPDPATQVSISYEAYFNGWTNDSNFYLPPDMIAPLMLWERTSGTDDDFGEMSEAQNGLQPTQQTTYQGCWEWRGDAIWMPGSLQAEDIRMRYACQLWLLDVDDIPNLDTVRVPIADCENALALKLAADYGFARGSEQQATAEQKAQKAVRLLQNRYIRAQQAIDYRGDAYGEPSNLWPLTSFHA